MSGIRLLILPLVCLSLTSFAGAADKPTLLTGTINPFSVVRIQDRVNYMVSLKFSDGRTIQQWRSVDCAQDKAQVLYWDLLDDQGLTKIRYYGNSYMRYAPAQDDQQMTREERHKICQFPAKEARWERLAATDSVGFTDIVDLNSIMRVEDILSVRMGYDLAEIAWEPPFDAPLGLKVENYFYNCKTHQGAALALMNIDPDGRVTDSLITADIARRQKDFEISRKMSQRFDQFCALKPGETFTGEGAFIPAKNKPASKIVGPSKPELSNNNPQFLAQYPLDADVERQAQSLIKPWATPRFKQVRFTQVSDLGRINVQLDAQPDGYIRKLEDYGIWKVQRLTMANLMQLKFTMSVSSSAIVANKLQTDLHFPLVNGQHFQSSWDNVDSGSKEATPATLNCKVTGEGDAQQLAPEFSGKYRLVECQETHKGQPDSLSTQAWLEQLNLFVPVTEQIKGKPESRITLENVSVN